MVPDAINAALYLAKGDYTNMALSSMAIIPFVGDAATGVKYADKAIDGAKYAGKYVDDVAEIGTKVYNKGATTTKNRIKTVKGLSPADRAAAKGYPGIKTTVNGGPDFTDSPYLYKGLPGEKSIVSIELTGSRGKDFTRSFNNANIPKNMRRTIKAKYTWHHVDDFDPTTGKSTMQLVERSAHEATYPHSGSVAQYTKHTGIKYR